MSTLAEKITDHVKKLGTFEMKNLYELFPNEKKTTIRGRIYRELMGLGVIKREGKGLYVFIGNNGEQGVIINGDARELKPVKDESLDLIVADHGYEIAKGWKNQSNSSYKKRCFKYNQEDFNEKARTLKEGAFLVEFLPEMKETNLDYIIKVLGYAKAAGFKFYCKIPWYKAEVRNGKLIDHSAFIGRKAVMEDVYIFSKGTPRKLRMRRRGQALRQEKGAAEMMPACFMVPPIDPKVRKHQSEKPEALIQKIISALSLEGEVVLDQFAGSFVTFFTAIKLKRRAIAIEIDEETTLRAIGASA